MTTDETLEALALEFDKQAEIEKRSESAANNERWRVQARSARKVWLDAARMARAAKETP